MKYVNPVNNDIYSTKKIAEGWVIQIDSAFGNVVLLAGNPQPDEVSGEAHLKAFAEDRKFGEYPDDVELFLQVCDGEFTVVYDDMKDVLSHIEEQFEQARKYPDFYNPGEVDIHITVVRMSRAVYNQLKEV